MAPNCHISAVLVLQGLGAAAAAAAAAAPLALTPGTFDPWLLGTDGARPADTLAVVEFYAPWCARPGGESARGGKI